MKVWCVWTESGAYEMFSRDLRGIFASAELAEAHAEQLRAAQSYDEVYVNEDAVLDSLPVSVPHVRYAAHINPDGSEDTGLGYDHHADWQTWSNEIMPLDSSRVSDWNNRGDGHRYIEVIGSEEALVAAEYARLLAEVRSAIASGESADALEAIGRLG